MKKDTHNIIIIHSFIHFLLRLEHIKLKSGSALHNWHYLCTLASQGIYSARDQIVNINHIYGVAATTLFVLLFLLYK